MSGLRKSAILPVLPVQLWVPGLLLQHARRINSDMAARFCEGSLFSSDRAMASPASQGWRSAGMVHPSHPIALRFFGWACLVSENQNLFFKVCMGPLESWKQMMASRESSAAYNSRCARPACLCTSVKAALGLPEASSIRSLQCATARFWQENSPHGVFGFGNVIPFNCRGNKESIC